MAGVLVGMLGSTATPALADPWTASATQSTTVTAATVGSRLLLVSGSGTVTTDGTQYSLGTVAGSVTGYVNLTNTSTVPATVSAVVATGNLVASTPATVCSVAWTQPAGTCTGTTTALPQNGTFSSTGLLAANGAVYLRVQTTGLLGTVTVTMNPVVPRSPGDRTAP